MIPEDNIKKRGGRGLERVGERKQRVDKKVEIKPTLSLDFKKEFYTFAELCNEPVKEIAERLCIKGMISDFIIDSIRKWFRRDYKYSPIIGRSHNKIAFGEEERPKLKITLQGDTGKITMRLVKEEYDQLAELAYALDLTPSSTVAVLLRMTTKNIEFMNQFVDGLRHLNGAQIKEVKRFASRTWGIQFHGGISGWN